jgi:hypothetical protein
VVARFLALLLAVAMLTGAVVQASAAPPGPAAATCVLDDAPDGPELDPAIVPVAVAVVPPLGPPVIRCAAPPLSAAGRRHAVRVFRPPCLLASR